MDIDALTPEDLYRFVPNYHWIDPGDSVLFLNTTGNHTVYSVPGIWPRGVKPVEIAHQDRTAVTLTEPGVYGFQCRVHNRHGMFALVVVGTPQPNIDEVNLSRLNHRGRTVFGQLFEKLEEDRKNRGL